MSRYLKQVIKGHNAKYGKYILLDNNEKLYYDVLINADDGDYDCIKIQSVPFPILKRYTAKSGKRVDLIQCNSLNENSIIQNGNPSYQSIEMMMTLSGNPNSEKGKNMLKKAREDYPLEYMREYYYHLSLAICLFITKKENFSISLRIDMLSRLLREFYPKAELLCKTKHYEDLDTLEDEMQSIKLDKDFAFESDPSENEKEQTLSQISQLLIERLKGKINSKFSAEFITKLEMFGVGKYLNDSLKNNFLNLAKVLDIPERGIEKDIVTGKIENLKQDIESIVRRNLKVKSFGSIFEAQQYKYDISDIENVIMDRKLGNIKSIINEIHTKHIKEEKTSESSEIDLMRNDI